MSESAGANIEGLSLCYVEDDAEQREVVTRALREHGFEVCAYPASRELYLGLLRSPCDIAILDVGLPGEDGFTVAANLRRNSDIGIIILTAYGDTDDRVQGLMGGADAYLVKPVEIRELIATVHSVGRRIGRGSATDTVAGSCGGWRMTLDNWCLVAPNGTQVPLSASERSVLEVLMREPERPVSREGLIVALGHDPEYYLPHRLDMLISRLRRKVLTQTNTALPLKAVRGVGFAFSPA